MKSLAAIVIALSIATVSFAQKVQVKVGDTEVKFDAAPRMINGVTMVPIRNMVTAMEGTMRWNLERQTVTVWRSNRRFDMTLNTRQASLNGKVVNMDEAAYMQKGRIFVPLKFVAEAAGYLISMENGWYVLRLTHP